MSDGWHSLDLLDVMRSLRSAAGLTQREALRLIVPGDPDPSASTLTSPEQRGARVLVESVLARAAAYGFDEVEIRVRKKST